MNGNQKIGCQPGVCGLRGDCTSDDRADSIRQRNYRTLFCDISCQRRAVLSTPTVVHPYQDTLVLPPLLQRHNIAHNHLCDSHEATAPNPGNGTKYHELECSPGQGASQGAKKEK